MSAFTYFAAKCTGVQILLSMQGPVIAIHHGDDVLDNMNPWSRDHHAASGLTQRCRESTTSMAEAEYQVPRCGCIVEASLSMM